MVHVLLLGIAVVCTMCCKGLTLMEGLVLLAFWYGQFGSMYYVFDSASRCR